MTMTGIFIDDQDQSAAAMMSTRGSLDFAFVPIAPLTRIATQVVAADPLVVALDYRLDEDLDSIDPSDAYKGSALAQHLRDLSIDQPKADFGIVLVSAEINIQRIFSPDRTAHDLFDRVYSKEHIERDRDAVRRELVALGGAYRALRAMVPEFDAGSILGLEPDEAAQLLTQELRLPIATAAAPHIVVRSLLRTIVLQPGLLCDDHDAAAVLGIQPAGLPELERGLREVGVAYTGLLSDGWGRWWTHRLEAYAEATFGTRPTSLSSDARTALMRERFGIDVAAAPSPWNGSTDELIALACGSCRRPVEMRHTVAAFDPGLPRYASRRRICWDCIQKDTFIHHGMLVDESDADLVPMIKGAERK